MSDNPLYQIVLIPGISNMIAGTENFNCRLAQLFQAHLLELLGPCWREEATVNHPAKRIEELAYFRGRC
jgi:hypothetical protein